METNPIELFKKWYNEELKLTKVPVPTACCLSTIGEDEFPNARFVSLKDVIDNGFIVTGTITSRKGIEIKMQNKVALTFWWTETERQIRVQGFAFLIDNDLADKFFSERSRESQIVSIVSDQGKVLEDIQILHSGFDELNQNFSNSMLNRPQNWSGYSIHPIRIEFLEFKSTRFHQRKLYHLVDGLWTINELQP